MNDKAALLHELKIQRGVGSQKKKMPNKRLVTIGSLGFIIIAAWLYFPSVNIQASKPEQTNAIVEHAKEDSRSVSPKTLVAPPQQLEGRVLLDASGYVIARKKTTVSSEVTGKLEQSFIEEGMVVEEGQVLARLDDKLQGLQTQKSQSLYEVSKAKVDQAVIVLQKEEQELIRFKLLINQGAVNRSVLERQSSLVDELSAKLIEQRAQLGVAKNDYALQKQLLANMQIVAPFSGVVVAKTAQVGEIISPVSAGGGFTRTGICTIVDMKSLEIEVDVNEMYIDRVKPGQEVNATLNSYPDWKIPARVIAIVPTADRAKASVKVRIAIEAKDPRILPEMSVKVSFLKG